jgi:acyl-CoA synthetase (NDP forming)
VRRDAACVFLTVDTFRPTTVLGMNALPLPAGDRVAIIDNAGDLNVLAADAAAKLQIVELSAALQTSRYAGVDLETWSVRITRVSSSG